MKVLFDTSSLYIAKTGVSNYIVELMAALQKSDLPVQVQEFAYTPLFSRKTPLRIFDSVYRDLLWPSVHLSAKAAAIDADIIHSPAFKFPLSTSQKLLITVHDIYAWVKPESFTFWHRQVGKRYISKAVNSHQHILVLTNFTKQEIIKYFPKANKNKIHVVPSGIPVTRRPNPDAALHRQVLKKHLINSPYLLSVSTIEPRKNFINLIKAFSTIVNKIDHTLVLVGQNGWNNKDVYRLIKDLKIEDRIQFTGFVSDEELNSLYTHADCFVFPSFYEGFGFTPLEAMKCGCPVVSSNASCMPEVLGEAAVYFKPDDIDEMANAILHVVQSEAVAHTYKSLGMQQAEQYDWGKTAINTFEVYRQIIKQDS